MSQSSSNASSLLDSRIRFMRHSHWCAGSRETWCEHEHMNVMSNERQSTDSWRIRLRVSWRTHFQQTSIERTKSSHRVDSHWLCDHLNLDQAIQIKHANINLQIADVLTKGSFSEDRLTQLMDLCLDYWHTLHTRTVTCRLFRLFVCVVSRTRRNAVENRTLQKHRVQRQRLFV